jgi:hypothetical protein
MAEDAGIHCGSPAASGRTVVTNGCDTGSGSPLYGVVGLGVPLEEPQGEILIMKIVAVASILLLAMFPVSAQQRADTTFQPIAENPAYPPGTGPVVLLDAAHHNFHTLDGRFWAFGTVLERDGYVVRSSDVPFSAAASEDAAILVISKAHDSKRSNSTQQGPHLVSHLIA